MSAATLKRIFVLGYAVYTWPFAQGSQVFIFSTKKSQDIDRHWPESQRLRGRTQAPRFFLHFIYHVPLKRQTSETARIFPRTSSNIHDARACIGFPNRRRIAGITPWRRSVANSVLWPGQTSWILPVDHFGGSARLVRLNPLDSPDGISIGRIRLCRSRPDSGPASRAENLRRATEPYAASTSPFVVVMALSVPLEAGSTNRSYGLRHAFIPEPRRSSPDWMHASKSLSLNGLVR